MCSIPGLPSPGSQANVLITKVNLNSIFGFVELWVNMDDGRKEIYELMRNEIQIPTRKFSGSEGKPEDLCLVRISDIWHRARIVSLQSETYNVFLLDQGQPHITTSEDLAWAELDTFFLSPEIESCILANVILIQKNLPEDATKFLLSLPGKKLTGLVQDVLMPDRIIVLDVPTISKILTNFGIAVNISAEEFKCIALKNVLSPKGEGPDDLCLELEQNLIQSGQLVTHDRYFYPELSTDTYEMVEVTEVTDQLNIVCKLLIFSKAVKKLSEQIHQHYEESSDIKEPLDCGAPCAAQGTDGRWHRSLLKQNIATSDGVVEVFHVDEGTTELVLVENIRPLLRKFLKLPVFTYVCSLAGINGSKRVLTTDERENLKSLLMNQSVVAKFDHYNLAQDVYDVAFYSANATCINNCFGEEEGFIPPSKLEQDLNMENKSVISFLTSLGVQQCLDLETKVSDNGDGSPEETLPSAKDSAPNGSTDAAVSFDSNVKAGSENLDSSMHDSVHPSGDLDSRVQGACGCDLLTIGTSINVKVCCIESPQKFWCQTTENENSFGCLTQDLQKHYASVHPQPIVESVCVALNSDDNMWHRAKIIANSNFPVVDVRFIDCGQTQKVPLQHVRPIDPAFLRVNAQAFQCCLFNPTNPTAVSCSEAASTEFQKFVDLGALSETGLKCVVKAVEYDQGGQILYLVDIETASDSACKLLAQKCAQSEAHVQIPSPIQSSAYSFSSHNIEVGGTEEMWVTSSETVNLFYCQLDKNSHLNEKIMQNVKEQLGQPRCSDQPLELGSIVIAKYTDQKWYRGQVAELSPKIKVQFVDFGETLAVNKCDIRSYVSHESIARDIPVLAVPLGLSNVPEEIPQEVNQWFADQAIGQAFKIAIVAIEEKGKLIVEMFDGPVNVNALVTEKMTIKKQHEMPKYWVPAAEKCVPTENPHTEIIDQSGQTESNTHQESVSGENVTPCFYKEPIISKTKMEMVYVSSIADPFYFWCQGTNTDDLNKLSLLTKMAGKTQEDMMLIETLGAGSPCLALFSNDNNWYRAQVIRRVDQTFHVVFIDYGNEVEVDINNVRSLPQSLLEIAPQAFFCCLGGFDKSKGSWAEEVYDNFYNRLIDKPLQLRVLNVGDHSEVRVPQYSVEIVCEGELVNTAMQSYWEPGTEKFAATENLQTEDLHQDGQRESSAKQDFVSEENVTTCPYKEPRISKTSTEMVYASCISEPHYFWCQGTNTEVLNKLTELAQEAGRIHLDPICHETHGPGSPCLALFSSDNKWYRAQTVSKTEDVLHVIFIDYGNESEVDIKNVRSLPQSLLEIPPQAFLCCLSGFNKSKGSWAEEVYDDFYHQLSDKPLQLRVLSVEDHSETKVLQHAVEIESGGMVVNALMEKYWKDLERENTGKSSLESVGQDENRTMAEHVAVRNHQ